MTIAAVLLTKDVLLVRIHTAQSQRKHQLGLHALLLVEHLLVQLHHLPLRVSVSPVKTNGTNSLQHQKV
jgi:hypothetical protein